MPIWKKECCVCGPCNISTYLQDCEMCRSSSPTSRPLIHLHAHERKLLNDNCDDDDDYDDIFLSRSWSVCHFTKKLRIPIYIQCNKIVFKTQQQCDDDHDHHADDVTKKKIENGGNGHIDIFILEDHIKYRISSWRPAPSLPTFAQWRRSFFRHQHNHCTS